MRIHAMLGAYRRSRDMASAESRCRCSSTPRYHRVADSGATSGSKRGFVPLVVHPWHKVRSMGLGPLDERIWFGSMKWLVIYLMLNISERWGKSYIDIGTILDYA